MLLLVVVWPLIGLLLLPLLEEANLVVEVEVGALESQLASLLVRTPGYPGLAVSTG